ncbi:hypothetical protein MJ923_20390 [Shewanella sp. 3B26]|uniref:Uncharacterized protein n=1 Tax=Shewanella zhuhaiensis TaxID=2919576 RepID=A0AAJ1BL69_9GAMM|nr:hypothetical protein [Shewanella zhuhaiensis]MCH4296668.1 hypothetical protein [Shewanella zhuhaiensis]
MKKSAARASLRRSPPKTLSLFRGSETREGTPKPEGPFFRNDPAPKGAHNQRVHPKLQQCD